ncbi:MAG TPA: zinc-dependent peptidase [Kiritimatiellia bacterium]|nr:zinc-dependent peptidase [Kiritimatiellia bacterium]HPS07920.1 zinc-dependent peptidase [Kiritimatiellia bacterium]
MLHPFRDHRRHELVQQPFPEEWSQIIDRNVACCRCLHPDERKHLDDLIKVFIREKHFEGCNGMTVTDEIKVTIAAQACLLLLNLRHDYYEKLVSILIYPESFGFEQEEQGLSGIVSVTHLPVAGLSSSGGAVALSWPDALAGAQQPGDGSNVVFHEFAHQLDLLDDAMNGSPVLDNISLYRDWAQVLASEYERLQVDVAAGTPSLISAYGTTKPAEFFAVVTELFFERPVELQREHLALYEEFRQYYRQDPAARLRVGPV